MKIAHITDLHLDDFLSREHRIDTAGNLNRILSEIEGSDIVGLVLTGDLGEKRALGRLSGLLDIMGMPFFCVPGNHDEIETLAGMDLINRKYIRNGEYYFAGRIGGQLCLFLDTSRGEMSGAQIDWLRRKMDGAGKERVFLFSHHPILDCDRILDRHLALKGKERIGSLLAGREGETYLFCGHYHSAHRTVRDRVVQHVTPSAIMQIRSEGETIVTDTRDFGFRVIHIGDTVRTEIRMLSPDSDTPGNG